MKSVFFFDIDGTLTTTNEIPEYNKKMLLKLKQQGHLTFICSGRPYAYVRELFKDLVDGYVLSNGRFIYYHNEIIFDYPLTPKQIEDYLKICDDNKAGCLFLASSHAYPNKEFLKNTNENRPYNDCLITEWKSTEIRPYMMDIFYKSDEHFHQLEKAFENVLILNNHYNHFSADTSTIDHTKGDGIKKLLEYLNEDVTTYAFGDGSNDIGMFKAVDIKIAMGNAIEPLKQMADYITLNCNDDGITHALKHYKIF